MINTSTKVSEKITFDGDDNMVIKRTFDASHMLKDAAQAREVTQNSFGSDYKHVGNVDMALLAVWLKEAGVDLDGYTSGQRCVKTQANEQRI